MFLFKNFFKYFLTFTNPDNSATNHDLHDITSRDQTTVYAVGQDGVILKSIDGGTTWVRKPSGTTNTLYELSFAANQGQTNTTTTNN
ncbi:MAG TPA: hypothetical protein VFF27_09445 [Bacteroidia bacterium]|jgi:photosystem II stability/assembly factor-like uncharacterized protein|nr:hypothetical protein [Bacteroidia bacterium]